jgi:hypothetical protein
MRILYKKVFASLVILTFGMSEMLYAIPVPQSPSVVAASGVVMDFSRQSILSDPSKLQVPFNNVTLKEIHKGSNGKLIIHIQDAHSNLSGQENLANALDYFMQHYKTHLVLVEGGGQDATLDTLRATASLEIWKRIARQLLYDGLIAGEEYLNLTTEHPMKIIGIENDELYDENLRAYADMVDKRMKILLYLHKSQISLDRVKNKLYPRELLKFEQTKEQSEKNQQSFKTKMDALFQLADKAILVVGALNYPETQKLRNIQESEDQVDFERANKEQADLFRQLSKKGASKKLKDILEAQKRTKNAQVSQYILLESIFRLAKENEVSIKPYRELQSYAEYLERFTELKLDVLLEELQVLEDEIYRKLLPTMDAKKIRAIDRYLRLLYNAYNIQMSSNEFATFIANEPDFPTKGWQAFVNRQLAQLGYFEDLVPYRPYLEEARQALQRFYNLVDERDFAFVENAKRSMAQENQEIAFLIAGGYHTAHLTELLREQDFSYVVLTPVVTYETNRDQYENILLAGLRGGREALKQAEVADKAQGEDSVRSLTPTRGIRAGIFARNGEQRLLGKPGARVRQQIKSYGARVFGDIMDALDSLSKKISPDDILPQLGINPDFIPSKKVKSGTRATPHSLIDNPGHGLVEVGESRVFDINGLFELYVLNGDDVRVLIMDKETGTSYRFAEYVKTGQTAIENLVIYTKIMEKESKVEKSGKDKKSEKDKKFKVKKSKPNLQAIVIGKEITLDEEKVVRTIGPQGSDIVVEGDLSGVLDNDRLAIEIAQSGQVKVVDRASKNAIMSADAVRVLSDEDIVKATEYRNMLREQYLAEKAAAKEAAAKEAAVVDSVPTQIPLKFKSDGSVEFEATSEDGRAISIVAERGEDGTLTIGQPGAMYEYFPDDLLAISNNTGPREGAEEPEGVITIEVNGLKVQLKFDKFSLIDEKAEYTVSIVGLSPGYELNFPEAEAEVFVESVSSTATEFQEGVSHIFITAPDGLPARIEVVKTLEGNLGISDLKRPNEGPMVFQIDDILKGGVVIDGINFGYGEGKDNDISLEFQIELEFEDGQPVDYRVNVINKTSQAVTIIGDLGTDVSDTGKLITSARDRQKLPDAGGNSTEFESVDPAATLPAEISMQVSSAEEDVELSVRKDPDGTFYFGRSGDDPTPFEPLDILEIRDGKSFEQEKMGIKKVDLGSGLVVTWEFENVTGDEDGVTYDVSIAVSKGYELTFPANDIGLPDKVEAGQPIVLPLSGGVPTVNVESGPTDTFNKSAGARVFKKRLGKGGEKRALRVPLEKLKGRRLYVTVGQSPGNDDFPEPSGGLRFLIGQDVHGTFIQLRKRDIDKETGRPLLNDNKFALDQFDRSQERGLSVVIGAVVDDKTKERSVQLQSEDPKHSKTLSKKVTFGAMSGAMATVIRQFTMPYISRKGNVRISVKDGEVKIEDLESTTGTLVEVIQPPEVRSGTRAVDQRRNLEQFSKAAKAAVQDKIAVGINRSIPVYVNTQGQVMAVGLQKKRDVKDFTQIRLSIDKDTGFVDADVESFEELTPEAQQQIQRARRDHNRDIIKEHQGEFNKDGELTRSDGQQRAKLVNSLRGHVARLLLVRASHLIDDAALKEVETEVLDGFVDKNGKPTGGIFKSLASAKRLIVLNDVLKPVLQRADDAVRKRLELESANQRRVREIYEPLRQSVLSQDQASNRLKGIVSKSELGKNLLNVQKADLVEAAKQVINENKLGPEVILEIESLVDDLVLTRQDIRARQGLYLQLSAVDENEVRFPTGSFSNSLVSEYTERLREIIIQRLAEYGVDAEADVVQDVLKEIEPRVAYYIGEAVRGAYQHSDRVDGWTGIRLEVTESIGGPVFDIVVLNKGEITQEGERVFSDNVRRGAGEWTSEDAQRQAGSLDDFIDSTMSAGFGTIVLAGQTAKTYKEYAADHPNFSVSDALYIGIGQRPGTTEVHLSIRTDALLTKIRAREAEAAASPEVVVTTDRPGEREIDLWRAAGTRVANFNLFKGEALTVDFGDFTVNAVRKAGGSITFNLPGGAEYYRFDDEGNPEIQETDVLTLGPGEVIDVGREVLNKEEVISGNIKHHIRSGKAERLSRRHAKVTILNETLGVEQVGKTNGYSVKKGTKSYTYDVSAGVLRISDDKVAKVRRNLSILGMNKESFDDRLKNAMERSVGLLQSNDGGFKEAILAAPLDSTGFKHVRVLVDLTTGAIHEELGNKLPDEYSEATLARILKGELQQLLLYVDPKSGLINLDAIQERSLVLTGTSDAAGNVKDILAMYNQAPLEVATYAEDDAFDESVDGAFMDEFEITGDSEVIALNTEAGGQGALRFERFLEKNPLNEGESVNALAIVNDVGVVVSLLSLSQDELDPQELFGEFMERTALSGEYELYAYTVTFVNEGGAVVINESKPLIDDTPLIEGLDLGELDVDVEEIDPLDDTRLETTQNFGLSVDGRNEQARKALPSIGVEVEAQPQVETQIAPYVTPEADSDLLARILASNKSLLDEAKKERTEEETPSINNETYDAYLAGKPIEFTLYFQLAVDNNGMILGASKTSENSQALSYDYTALIPGSNDVYFDGDDVEQWMADNDDSEVHKFSVTKKNTGKWVVTDKKGTERTIEELEALYERVESLKRDNKTNDYEMLEALIPGLLAMINLIGTINYLNTLEITDGENDLRIETVEPEDFGTKSSVAGAKTTRAEPQIKSSDAAAVEALFAQGNAMVEALIANNAIPFSNIDRSLNQPELFRRQISAKYVDLAEKGFNNAEIFYLLDIALEVLADKGDTQITAAQATQIIEEPINRQLKDINSIERFLDIKPGAEVNSVLVVRKMMEKFKKKGDIFYSDDTTEERLIRDNFRSAFEATINKLKSVGFEKSALLLRVMYGALAKMNRDGVTTDRSNPKAYAESLFEKNEIISQAIQSGFFFTSRQVALTTPERAAGVRITKEKTTRARPPMVFSEFYEFPSFQNFKLMPLTAVLIDPDDSAIFGGILKASRRVPEGSIVVAYNSNRLGSHLFTRNGESFFNGQLVDPKRFKDVDFSPPRFEFKDGISPRGSALSGPVLRQLGIQSSLTENAGKSDVRASLGERKTSKDVDLSSITDSVKALITAMMMRLPFEGPVRTVVIDLDSLKGRHFEADLREVEAFIRFLVEANIKIPVQIAGVGAPQVRERILQIEGAATILLPEGNYGEGDQIHVATLKSAQKLDVPTAGKKVGHEFIRNVNDSQVPEGQFFVRNLFMSLMNASLKSVSAEVPSYAISNASKAKGYVYFHFVNYWRGSMKEDAQYKFTDNLVDTYAVQGLLMQLEEALKSLDLIEATILIAT